MKTCAECGKEFEVLYPDLWRYKRGKWTNFTYYCSWKCLRKQEIEKEAKEAMGRPRKDGTPAKKPEKKTVVEVAEKLPEEAKVELVLDESILEKYRQEHPEEYQKQTDGKIFGQEPLEVYAIRSRVLRDGIYKKHRTGTALVLSGLSVQQDEIMMSRQKWIALSQEILIALEQLGVKDKDEA